MSDVPGSDLRQVWAGDVVTYHGEEGDIEAILIQHRGIGANLSYDDVWLYNITEGPNEGQWDAIPPRRRVASEE